MTVKNPVSVSDIPFVANCDLDLNDTAPARLAYDKRMSYTEKLLGWDEFCEDHKLGDRRVLQWTESLYPLWMLYTSGLSPSNIAASRRMCGLLCALSERLCWDHGIPRVLDLGSGLSTASLRTLGTVKLTSVDTSNEWLGKTAEFLAANGLPTQNLHNWTDFLAVIKADFVPWDIVFYDLGSIAERGKHLRSALSMGKIVILDDVHHYEGVIREVLGSDHPKVRVYDLKMATLDDYGRYAWVVVHDEED